MKCFNPKCTSGKPGKLQPIVLLWATGHSPLAHQPAELTMHNCLICEPCKGLVTPRTFVTDDIQWMKICNHFKAQRKLLPDLKRAQLAFVLPGSLKLDGERAGNRRFS